MLSGHVSKVLSYANYIGSAVFSLGWNRFFFSIQFTYNRFYFRSRNAFDASQLNVRDYVNDISFKGTLHDWML